MLSKKNYKFYYDSFLPTIYSIVSMKYTHGDDVTLSKSALQKYLKVGHSLIFSCFDKAMEDNLLPKYQLKSYIDEEFLTRPVIYFYIKKEHLVQLENVVTKYFKKLSTIEQEDIFNEYIYCSFSPKKQKQVDRKKAKHAELNAKYIEKYYVYAEMLLYINAMRPEKFRSHYLLDGRNRETNIMSHTLNPDKKHKQTELLPSKIKERFELLEEFFGTDKIVEFDTNGSIYRLTYNLTHDTLLSHDTDVYALNWKLCEFNKPLTKEAREYFKVLHMPIYMVDGKKNAYNANCIGPRAVSKRIKREDLQKHEALCYLCEYLHIQPTTLLDRMTKALRRLSQSDTFFKQEIFIHESNLHILMLREFQRRGIKAINVYDGFYFIEGTMNQALYNNIYNECVLDLKRLNTHIEPPKYEEYYDDVA